MSSNKIILMVYEAVKTYINDQVGWWVYMVSVILVYIFLRGSMRAEGMGCGRRWFR